MRKLLSSVLAFLLCIVFLSSGIAEGSPIDLSQLSLDELRQLQIDVASEIGNRLTVSQKEASFSEKPASTNYDSPTGHTIRELFPCADLANLVLKESGMISLDQPIPEGKLNAIWTLNWSNMDSSMVIDSFEGIQYLYGLGNFQPYEYADYSKLTYLPDGFYDLKNVWRFDLSCAPNVPIDWERIFKMESIRELYVAGKDVVSVSPSISRLTSLRSLTITNTSIFDLPDSIGDLTTLTYLSLKNNPYLSVIPACVFKLTNLETLNLSKTLVSEIPDDIANLIKLDTLNISYTKIKALPESMYKLNLSTFNTDGLILN